MSGRLMGIDFGTRRIGVAVADPAGTMAHPVLVIERTSFDKDIARLKACAVEYGIGRVVLGLPLNMDGTPGRLAGEVTGFGRRVEKELGVPVELFDERLTSHAADRLMMDAADLPPAKRRQVRDKIAAAIILESYLSRRAGPGS